MQGNVVEHQGEEGFVGAPFHPEQGGDQAPQPAADNSGKKHDCDQQDVVPRTVVEREIGSADRASDNLPLCADVPEFHLEGEGDPKRGDQQRDHDLDRRLYRHLAAERARKDGPVDFKRVVPDQQDEHTARNQRENERLRAQQHDLAGGLFRPLDHPQQRFLAHISGLRAHEATS